MRTFLTHEESIIEGIFAVHRAEILFNNLSYFHRFLAFYFPLYRCAHVLLLRLYGAVRDVLSKLERILMLAPKTTAVHAC